MRLLSQFIELFIHVRYLLFQILMKNLCFINTYDFSCCSAFVSKNFFSTFLRHGYSAFWDLCITSTSQLMLMLASIHIIPKCDLKDNLFYILSGVDGAFRSSGIYIRTRLKLQQILFTKANILNNKLQLVPAFLWLMNSQTVDNHSPLEK